MITLVSCNRTGQMVYHFDNGLQVSIVWGWGSYSDNHMPVPFDPKDVTERTNWVSGTVEVYEIGEDTNGFGKYLERRYGNFPAAYVPVEDIPKILSRADWRPRDVKSK